MIPNNVLHRVFQVKFGESMGTMFAIDVAEKQYLITARHVVEKWDQRALPEIYYDHQWRPFEARLLGDALDGADISVLVGKMLFVSREFTMEPTQAGIILAQDVFFLGFPYGWKAEVDAAINRGFPLPFVKKALLSAMTTEDGKNVLYLDGHNNPGFSGGPVVFRDPWNRQMDSKVCAVISGYRYTNEPIFSGEDPVPLAYKYNTGIIVAYGIKSALDVIAERPEGFPIP